MNPSNGTPPLSERHLADLRASALTDETVTANGLYTVKDADDVRAILGNYLTARTARSMGPCLAFPYLDADGRPMEYADGDGTAHPYVRLKPDSPRKGKHDGRPIKYESPLNAACRVYIPAGTRAALADPTAPLLITEGEKKALCADQHGIPSIGLPGVWGWVVKRPKDEATGRGIGPRELIPDLDRVPWNGRLVTIAFDSDIVEKPGVQWAQWFLAELLRGRGATVHVASIPSEPDGGKNGLDDYIARHGAAAFRRVLARAKPPTRPEKDDPRPTIHTGVDEYRVNADAAAALAAEPDLYQRAGMLVEVVKSDPEPDPHAAVRRPPGCPVVRDIPQALLRERLTGCAQWIGRRKDRNGEWEEFPTHPPDWSVAAVHARGRWAGIRRLEAVVDHPVVLDDGTVLTRNGYDRRSGLLVCVPDGLRLSIPSEPTRKDVAEAVATVRDVIADFPFEKDEHRAAWLAGMLTPLCHFGFEGPAPLFLIDKNVRGAGAGLLADVASLILTGRRFPVMSYTNDREELRKRITSLAMEGERFVLLDNLAGPVGNDVLDAALTADRWKDRLLGGNRVYDGPLHVCWYATGNNVQLHADTARRVCHIRMETSHEMPELRTGFKYPDLRRHVRECRGRLLSAALTLVRGWIAAGRPRHRLDPWGSFEGWSDVVREVVVFAGLPDPGTTRLALQTAADRDAEAMRAMIAALERFDPARAGSTTGEIVEAVRKHISKPGDPAPAWYGDLKSAVEDLCGKLDSRVLSYRFRQFARRNFAGKMIDRKGTAHGGAARWAVCEAVSQARSAPRAGDDGADGDHVPAGSASGEEGVL